MSKDISPIETAVAMACSQAMGSMATGSGVAVQEMAKSGKLVSTHRLNKLAESNLSIMKLARSALGFSETPPDGKTVTCTEMKEFIDTSRGKNIEFDKQLQVFALEFDKVRLASEAVKFAKTAINEQDLKKYYQQLLTLGIISPAIRKQRRREAPDPPHKPALSKLKGMETIKPVINEQKSDPTTTEKRTEDSSQLFLEMNLGISSKKLKRKKKEKLVKKMIVHIAQSNNANDLMSIRDSLIDFSKAKRYKDKSSRGSNDGMWAMQDASEISVRVGDCDSSPLRKHAFRKESFEKIPLLSTFEGSCSNFNQEEGSILPEFSLMMGNSTYKY